MVTNQALPPIVLASQSSRRIQLLRELVTDFQVVPSAADELEDGSLGPRRLCEINAQRKALVISKRFPEHLVIGADTLVFLDQEPLSKPPTLAAARIMLGRLSGKTHEVITGVCLIHSAGSRLQVFSDATRVRFRTLSAAEIEDYLALVPVLDKAGAYALQEEGHRLVEQVEGSRSNVIGLPIEALRHALERW